MARASGDHRKATLWKLTVVVAPRGVSAGEWCLIRAIKAMISGLHVRDGLPHPARRTGALRDGAVEDGPGGSIWLR